MIALGRLGIVLLVGLSYPLQLLPCRACVNGLTSSLDQSASGPTSTAARDIYESENEDEDDPLMPKGHEDDHDQGSIGDMSNTKFLIITAGILVSGFVIALAVDELEVGKLSSMGLKAFLLTRLLRQSLALSGRQDLRLSPLSSPVSSFFVHSGARQVRRNGLPSHWASTDLPS